MSDIEQLDLLIGKIRQHPVYDDAWDHVMSIHRLRAPAVFRRLAEMLESSEPLMRRLAADALGQLGYTDRPFACDTLPLLERAWAIEEDEDVLDAIGTAFYHLRPHADAAPELILTRLRDERPVVRFGVVMALLWSSHSLAIQGLLSLMEDDDDDVRDWATFGIANSEVDTPVVREALRARLNDPCPEVRLEAIDGLAQRGEDAAGREDR